METTFFLIIFEGVVNIGDKIIFFMSDADPGCVTTISGTKSVVLSFWTLNTNIFVFKFFFSFGHYVVEPNRSQLQDGWDILSYKFNIEFLVSFSDIDTFTGYLERLLEDIMSSFEGTEFGFNLGI